MTERMRNYFRAERDRLPNALTPEQAQALLPKVGDRMKKVPVFLKTQMEKVPPMWGQVVYVNAPHLWYTMQFQEGGCRFRESFKVPEQKGV